MEILGVNIALVTAISVIVLGIVEWFKVEPMPKWAIRLISLVISFAVVGLTLLVNPMTWQVFIVTGSAVFFVTNGIWHGANRIGRHSGDPEPQ